MQKIFAHPAELEKLTKEKYAIPPFLMMENAAKALANFILDFSPEHVVILCGKGNNGGDGYAVARLLQNKCEITIVKIEDVTADEAKIQYEICQRLGIKITDRLPSFPVSLILDCIYGTGFHGELPEKTAKLLAQVNQSKAIKIACDIPSGLYFQADYTITMGSQKLSLYSDKAKDVCGKIIVKDIGLARSEFESPVETQIYLIEESDIILPLRKKRAAHKGTYGHTTVFCGDKAGAAILTATAAMNFGSGLTTLLSKYSSDLSQFKISPSLMISDEIPKKTTAISAGSGFTKYSVSAAQEIKNWFQTQKNPAAVFDAGIVTAQEFPALLKELNIIEDSRIILTPHLAEFSTLMKNLGEEVSVSSLVENPQIKIELGKKLNSLFSHTTIIIKSANTFIASNDETYIISDGPQSLAKGGSGDILAGLCVSLLAQGYSAKDAAITAAEYHALLARQIGEQAYNLSPDRLLDLI